MIPLLSRPYLSALAMGSSHNRALYKCPITFTLTTAQADDDDDDNNNNDKDGIQYQFMRYLNHPHT